jgi:hypothetical protein
VQEAEASAADSKWKSDVAKSGHRHVVKTAYIGAGAAIAYEVATRSPNEDPAQAIIIGSFQPWDGKRGPGVVNHPNHMISPMLQFIGDPAGVNGKWLDRGDFSGLIAEVFTRSLIPRWVRNVTAISRKPDGFYEIVVENTPEPVYAKNVVFGAGAGGHKAPEGVTPATVEGNIASTPIMDMDLWTSVADKLIKGEDGKVKIGDPKEHKGRLTMVLSGPNAGIDVAFEALTRGYEVIWIIGSKAPPFLPGFTNYAAYGAYLRAVRGTPDEARATEKMKAKTIDDEIVRVDKEIAELYKNQDKRLQEAQGRLAKDAAFKQVIFGYLGAVKQTDTGVEAAIKPLTGEKAPDPVKGDLLVYAQGQDSAPFELLKAFAKDLLPQDDPAAAFGTSSPAAVGLQSPDGSLRVVGASAFRLGLQMTTDPRVVGAMAVEMRAALDALEKALAQVEKPPVDLKLLGNVADALQAEATQLTQEKGPDPLGKPDRDVRPSKGLREAFTKIAATYASHRSTIPDPELPPEAGRALWRFDAALAAAGRQSASEQLESVIQSLPHNVLANDQLTPSRSEAVAAHAFLPHDAARHVSFATGDRNALATYLVAKYPKLADRASAPAENLALDAPAQPPWTVARVVSAIVASRRRPDRAADLDKLHADVRAAPSAVPPHDAEFQAYWQGWLDAGRYA